nr:hypothetical protein [uncultured Flavobacterium sp.]
MKNISNFIKKAIFPILGIVLLASCDDEHDFTPYETSEISSNAANVKFIHAVVGPNGTNFSVNYFLGADKISGAMASGAQYPIPANYALVKSGTQPLSVRTTATTPVTVFEGSLTTELGKYYSNFLVTTPPSVTPPVYSTYQINDDLSVANLDKTKAYIRFINVISNTPAAGYDLGLIKETSLAGTAAGAITTKEVYTYRNVTFKGGDEKFVAIEAQVGTDSRGYQIQLRTAGAPANLPGATVVANQANSGTGIFVPRAGRIYTIYCRGIADGLPAGSTTNKPTISWYTNK